MKKNKIQKSDFQFLTDGFGAYKVTYTSPVTFKSFTTRVTDMGIIDDTKNCDNPKIKDLNTLKSICKR